MTAAVPSEERLALEKRTLDLRRAGATYQEIADELGYKNRGTAYKALRRALGRTLQDSADNLRELEAARLDQLQLGSWKAAMRGDPKAVANVLRVMERRAKLLGLDAPAKTELTGAGGNPLVVVLDPDLIPREEAPGDDEPASG